MASKAESVRRFIGGRPRLDGLFETAAYLSLAAAVLGLFDFCGWPYELPTHFRLQLVLVLGVATVIWLLTRRRLRATLFGISAATMWLLCGLPLSGHGRLPAAEKGSPAVFRMCSFNVHAENRDTTDAINFLEAGNFDAVVLLEINQRWCDALQALHDRYPFIACETREDDFGIAILARKRPLKSEIIHVGSEELPTVDADFGFIRVIGTHPLPPGSRRLAVLRDEQLGSIAKQIHGSSRTVVIGDLNCTPWSAPFRKFKIGSGLSDTFAQFGWQPTWPAFCPSLLRIPIDHALISSDLVCVARSIGPDLGSDHRPLIIEIAATEISASAAPSATDRKDIPARSP